LISIIVAASENGVIGVEGDLPWRLPKDLKHFKATTLGKPVIMGRKTWESLGRPLPGRQNVVITRQEGYAAAGCDVVASPGDALRACAGAAEVMVIGGSQIYAAFLRPAKRMYLTRVHTELAGDAHFPSLDDSWVLLHEDPHMADDTHAHAFTIRTYERPDHF
jgi:dihydrofolate reductase